MLHRLLGLLRLLCLQHVLSLLGGDLRRKDGRVMTADGKKQLRAVDVERLENASLATIVLGLVPVRRDDQAPRRRSPLRLRRKGV